MARINRPIALIGVAESNRPTGLSGLLDTSLSPETAIRSGFDVFLATPPPDRRTALDLIRLSEEAAVRIGLPRWLRRQMSPVTTGFDLVNIVAAEGCDVDQLVDLALWLTGTTGVQRLEAEWAGPCVGMALRSHSGALMCIQTMRSVQGVRVSAEGGQASVAQELPYDATLGIRSEIERFAGLTDDVVFLEDSLETIAVLERVKRRTR